MCVCVWSGVCVCAIVRVSVDLDGCGWMLMDVDGHGWVCGGVEVDACGCELRGYNGRGCVALRVQDVIGGSGVLWRYLVLVEDAREHECTMVLQAHRC